MAKVPGLVRKNVMLEQQKVHRLVKKLGVTSESEAIRIAIDNFLFGDQVMRHVRELRRRGTVRDVYHRVTERQRSRS